VASEDDTGLGDRPPGDALVRAVARARIANELFASDHQVKLGRYHLLERVGEGGMGVVWGAWDPELERRVALKMVRNERQATRDRILREGQALAKLSHPNVVPVYDVGVVEDQVYVVMEWVRGTTLRQWGKAPHPIREIVAVYRQAAQGLAAAHAAGLIHRDFKPDNAIRGDDGRVRVLDFGLARDAGDEPDADGTPHYMAPEQRAGERQTAAVDQFAFCASLREALGPDEPPHWLAEICARGTAPAPGDRFASMDELLSALARDPRVVWRRRVLVAAGLVATAGAFAVGTYAGGDRVEHCVAGGSDIARTWNPPARAKLLAHLAGLGPYAKDEAPRLEQTFARYAETWSHARDAACSARDRGDLTPALYERTIGCLARARASLDTTIDVLATADDARFPNAVVAAHSLADPDGCGAETAASKVAPPARAIAAAVGELANQLERARVLAVAVDPLAVDAAAAGVAQANRLGYPQLVARANVVHGLALTRAHRTALAASALDHGARAALDADDDDLFVEAYAREVYAISVTEKATLDPATLHAPDLLPYAERIAARAGVSALARARLFNDLGVARLAVDDHTTARAWFDKALVEAGHAPPAVELAGIYGNVALVVDDPVGRDRALADEIAAYTRELGENHPLTLEARLAAAMFARDRTAAAATLRDTIARMQRLHPHLRETVDDYLYELGWLAEERGDVSEARRAFAEIRQPPNARVAPGYVALLDGKLEEAARTMTALGRELEGSTDYWLRVAAADAYMVAATAALNLHRDADAIASLARALPLLENIEDMPAYRRRLARCRAALARLLATREPARAHDLATRAIAWYRDAIGYDRELAELAAIAR